MATLRPSRTDSYQLAHARPGEKLHDFSQCRRDLRRVFVNSLIRVSNAGQKTPFEVADLVGCVLTCVSM